MTSCREILVPTPNRLKEVNDFSFPGAKKKQALNWREYTIVPYISTIIQYLSLGGKPGEGSYIKGTTSPKLL
jgi:hypothetical protein